MNPILQFCKYTFQSRLCAAQVENQLLIKKGFKGTWTGPYCSSCPYSKGTHPCQPEVHLEHTCTFHSTSYTASCIGFLDSLSTYLCILEHRNLALPHLPNQGFKFRGKSMSEWRAIFV